EEQHGLVFRVLLPVQLRDGCSHKRLRISQLRGEPAPLDDQGALSKDARRLFGPPAGVEQQSTRQSLPERFQAPQSRILPREPRPTELDDIDLQALAGEALEESGEERAGLGLLMEGGMDQVDAQHSQG